MNKKMIRYFSMPALGLLVGCGPAGSDTVRKFDALERAQTDDVAGNNAAARDGEEAFAAGAPASANPFQGAPGYTKKSQSWLAGWIRASEKAKQKPEPNRFTNEELEEMANHKPQEGIGMNFYYDELRRRNDAAWAKQELERRRANRQ